MRKNGSSQPPGARGPADPEADLDPHPEEARMKRRLLLLARHESTSRPGVTAPVLAEDFFAGEVEDATVGAAVDEFLDRDDLRWAWACATTY